MPNQKIAKEISRLAKKPEMWIGIAVMVILVVFGITLIVKNIKRNKNSQLTNKNIISPIISITPSATPSAALKKDNKLQNIVKKLADTAGEFTYQVVDGDSYWKISEKTCGTGKYFETIQQLNRNKDLQSNDSVQIVCE